MKKIGPKVSKNPVGAQFPSRRKKLALAVSAGAMLASPFAYTQNVLEEVIVTAQRREQSVIDVPYSISVIGGEMIKNAGAANADDVLRMIPGLAFDNGGTKQQLNSSLILRGVNFQSPGFTNSFQNLTDAPVSMYVGEIPVFSVIQMTDIERVEVLRGPQGTLYGSGAVGGTVKFHFNKPDTENKVFDVSSRLGGNSHSDELNYNVNFVGNLPISDNVAIRVAGGYQDFGGVTDANGRFALEANTDPASTGPVSTNSVGTLPSIPVFSQPVLSDPTDPDSAPVIEPIKDIDDFETWFVRASVLWDVSDDIEVLASWYHQEDDGFGDTAAGVIGDDPNNTTKWAHTLRRGSEDLKFKTDIAALEISADVGFGTITSATGYSYLDKDYTNDISGLYQRLDDFDFFIFPGFGSYGGFPRLTTPSPQLVDETETFTEEIRLVTDTGSNWDAVVGFYYEDSRVDVGGYDLWPGYYDWLQDPTTGVSTAFGTPSAADALVTAGSNPGLGYPFTLFRNTDFEEKALFGELTFRVTDKWQITGGVRVFWQDFDQSLFNSLPICGTGCSTTGTPADGIVADESISTDIQDEIFKINTSYDFHEDHKVYFTWAEGFRRGGANPFGTSGTLAPAEFATFESDKATNWEVGIKGMLMDNRVRYSMAGYLIEWDKPQTDGFFGPFALPAVINAEEAETMGFEVEVTAAPTENWLITFGYNYVNAEFSKDATTLAGLSGTLASISDGDPLPGVPEHMASWSVDYFHPLQGGAEIHANLNGSVRSSITTFPNANFRDFASIDGFSLWNASIDYRVDNWSVGAFVKNIGDEQAVTGARIFQAEFDDRASVGRPRSFGVSVNYSFY